MSGDERPVGRVAARIGRGADRRAGEALTTDLRLRVPTGPVGALWHHRNGGASGFTRIACFAIDEAEIILMGSRRGCSPVG